MAHDNRPLITDLNGKPVPQVYNPVTDAFEPLQGSAAGGPRTMLYDATGNPLFTDAKPGSVKLTGSNVLDNAESLGASFEKDADGNGVLRMIEVSPVAYDEASDMLKIKPLETNRLSDYLTLPASASYTFTINPLYAKQINVAVRESGTTSATDHAFRVVAAWMDTLGGFLKQPPDLINTSTTIAQYGLSSKIDVETSHLRITITNNDTIAHTYRVEINNFLF